MNYFYIVDSVHNLFRPESYIMCDVDFSSWWWFTVKFVVSRYVFCKLQSNFGFFCSVSYLSRPLRKHMVTWTSSKGHGLWFVIGGFQFVWFVSMFQSSLLVIILFWAIIASKIFPIFLILVICKNKAISASFPGQKFHSWSGFPLPFPVLFWGAKLGAC